MTDQEIIYKAIREVVNTDNPAEFAAHNSTCYTIAKNVCEELREKLNSLPDEQQPSEDLGIDEELKRFFEINNLFVDANDLQTVRHCNGSPVDKRYYFEDIARHFAQWQKEQIMKGLCYETKVYRDEEGDGIDTPIESWLALENNEITNLPNIGLKEGDKVKILIIKEDEQ